MSNLIVYRASAGSGKTYRLACEYLKQIVREPENYRRILAVTFTNKATAEMKGRIVEELYSISQGKTDGMASEIGHDLGLEISEVQRKASKALSLILHNYTLFSVSTIDSFVQRVIQALLWEIGEQGGAEIQLDPTPILTQAADNLLDSASQVKELLGWLTQMGQNLMDEGGSWDVRKRLVGLGSQLFSETFRLMSEEEIERFTSKENVENLRGKLYSLLNTTINRIVKLATVLSDLMDDSGVKVDMLFQKQRGVWGFIESCKKIDASFSNLPEPNSYVQKSVLDSTGYDWVNKKVSDNEQVFPGLQQVIVRTLHPKLVELVEIIESQRAAYISAKLILKNLENLALIGDLWRKVRELSQQEGFLLLSDSGHLLREFVKDTDAPFVFEKIGNRYDSFMIDEFQDTSVVQWCNFKPLIENSLSQDSFSMVVGDVKQSVYRWRNGDWSILSSGLYNDFSHHGIDERVLSTNWRSQPVIVNFNNHFFRQTIGFISNTIGQKLNEGNRNIGEFYINQLKAAYKDIEQQPRPNLPNNSGYVSVNLFENSEDLNFDGYLTRELPERILEINKRYRMGDIAMLVRSKTDGQKVANMLLEHNNLAENKNRQIKFVSQEGLYLSASKLVRLVISALRLTQNPSNDLQQRVLIRELAELGVRSYPSWHDAFTMGFLEEDVIWLGGLSVKSLQECFDIIVKHFQLDRLEGELVYLAELHEVIITQSHRGYSEIGRFLEWWDENSESLSLSVPEAENSVSIITIHKSKGLEFPVVIIPYAGWSYRAPGKSPLLWVSSEDEPFNMLPRYPVFFSYDAEKSLFERDALEELVKEHVDNVNLLYVAFTRAQNEMYVYSQMPSPSSEKNTLTSISKLLKEVVPIASTSYMESQPDVNFSQDGNSFSFGKCFVDREMGRMELQNTWNITRYSFEGEVREIKIRTDSNDFFNSQPQEKETALQHGKLMHQLFSLINSKHDVNNAVRSMVSEGLIEKSKADEVSERVSELLSDEPFSDWFSGTWIVKPEASILTPEGKLYRPDRVMVKEGRTVVVDFKFGAQLPQHKQQVKNYAKLLGEMGYENIESFLWYVDGEEVIKL